MSRPTPMTYTRNRASKHSSLQCHAGFPRAVGERGLSVYMNLAACFLLFFSAFAFASAPAAYGDQAPNTTVYRKALPGYKYKFPQDHFSHDDFKTEWWYYTGHLKARDGRRFGFELTFFRTGSDYKQGAEKSDGKAEGLKADSVKADIAKAGSSKTSPWKLDNFYLAHFAVTDESGKTFRYYEKLNRKGLKFADARQDAYFVHNEGWSVAKLGEKYVLKADARDYGIYLLLTPAKPPVVHGKNGVSQKASCAGCASHYYSMSRLQAEGLLFQKDKPIEVSGLAWMDHEFGSNQLTSEQTGWDWFSIQLAGNRELMLYVMRREDGSFEKQSSGTYVLPDGSSRHLDLADFKIEKVSTWMSPKTKGIYPMGWKISVPKEKLQLTLVPLLQDQELTTERSTGVSYWEGAVDVLEGSEAKPSGNGYVEMTGYSEKFSKKL
ncbi:MAG TPA: lipocalin-like domain-containing protein [Candidatus Obscuribacter sp.]|nr:lipocalin-like domain-containing protein [Candidatus Obscuribacter sp.]HND06443.1 lipocalin-like domain-containing protein [Candidatus Obscuribacter sp.]HND65986.1 lipocalin-like domain-containing protein [Candidatus Obscuribacter sp.]HNM50021.1 lipocalin-like domain-containing protein [Candidatus Obscuribacter sp.]